MEEWSIEDCTKKFLQLCGAAFTSRGWHGVPVMEQLSAMNHQWSRYKTKPMVELLQSSFANSKQRLFGGGNATNTSAKVAVTAATDTFETPVVMANYNRPIPGLNDKRMAYSSHC